MILNNGLRRNTGGSGGGGGTDPQTGANTASIANNLAAVTSAQADLDTAEAALLVAQQDIAAIDADNATQTELDAAQAAQDAAQLVVDTAQDTLATARQTAQDAIELELDGIIANTGEVVAIGSRVLPLDDPRPYINNTVAPITLTGNTVSAITGDGLVLDVVAVSGLRGAPVADNAALTALVAQDYERRKVLADGNEYVFELGAISGTLADDLATGFWQLQIAEGLVSTPIDSSAGAITQTLAASTGSGVVRLFTNEDVTNTATLAVQAGETINGVVDGTFLFSNYTAGTQFRVDEVTGGWVVSVVGASSVRTLEFIAGNVTDITGVSGTAVVYNATTTPSSSVSINSIEYYDEGNFRNIRIEMALFDDDLSVFEIGTNLMPSGGKVVDVQTTFQSISDIGTPTNGSPIIASPNQFAINRVNSIDSVNSLFVHVKVYNPAGEGAVVLAGMVTSEDHKDLILNGVGATEIPFSNSLTIAEIISNYESLEINTWSAANNSSSTGLVSTAALQKSIDNGATEHRVFLSAGYSGSASETHAIDIHLVNNEIDIFSGAIDAPSTTTETTVYGVKSQKTVVMPEALAPESLSYYHEKLNTGTAVATGDPVPFNEGLASIGGSITHSGGVFTLAANKTYKLTVDAKVDDTGVGFAHRWRNLTDSVLIGNTAQSLPVDAAVGAGGHALAIAIITTTQETQVQVENVEGASRTVRADSHAWIEELPSSTVLVESDIPLEDAEVELYSGSHTSTDTGIVLNGAASWNDVYANYDKIKIYMRADALGRASSGEFLSDHVELESQMHFYSNGANFANIERDANTTNTFSVNNTVGDGLFDIVIFGVKAQKTLLNTTATPINNNELLRAYEVNNLGDSTGAVNIDFTAVDNVRLNLTGDVTLTMIDPPLAAAMVRVHVEQDATGGHAITFPANVLGDFTGLDTGANANEIIQMYFDGTNYHG